MPTVGQSNQRQHRTDLRALDHHESWRGVYALLEVEPEIEPTTSDQPRLFRGIPMSLSLTETTPRELASPDRILPTTCEKRECQSNHDLQLVLYTSPTPCARMLYRPCRKEFWGASS